MFGQYAQGSRRFTKGDLEFNAMQAGLQVETSRKAGHNRLDFTTQDGRRCFMLHKTIIAELSEDGSTLTLNDGGWATMTTRRAMTDAIETFGLSGYVGSGGGGSHSFWGHTFDRTATFNVETREVIAAPRAPYIVRATDECGAYGRLEVTYDGETLRSTGLEEGIPLKPAHAVRFLRMILNSCRNARAGGSVEGFDMIGFWVQPARFGTTVDIGCHDFKRQDLSQALRRIETDYPMEAAKTRKSDGAWKKRAKGVT